MEHGGDDGYPAGFPGIELLSTVLDEVQLYDEDDEMQLYNDVNFGEAFYLSATAGDILRENDNNRCSPLDLLQPQPARNLPAKIEIPVTVANLQTEKTSFRSEVLTEPCFNGIITSSGSTRWPAPADLIRVQIGQYSGCNAVRSEGFHRQGGIVRRSPVGDDNGGGDGVTTLFVGELHWWTTDADLEQEICKYGPVKGVRFFEEKSNGKSKGCAQVELYDLASAISCQEGMNGHIFNGRSCVVAISSPQGVRKRGEAQVSRNQQGLFKGPSRFVIAQTGGGRAHIAGDSGRDGSGGGDWGVSEIGNIGIHMGNSSDLAGLMCGGGVVGNGGTTGFPLWPARGAFRRRYPVVAPNCNPTLLGGGMSTGGVGIRAEPSVAGWRDEEQSSHGSGAASDRRHGRDKGRWNVLEWSELKDCRERNEGLDKADIWKWGG